MTFSIEDLESLALWLDRASDVSKAKAAEFAAHNDKENVNRQADRAIKFGRYADTCREAARRLRVRATRKTFTPPTREEVFAYAKELGWPMDDAAAWHDHFESQGWRVSGKAIMSDWKAAARNGHRRWKEKQTREPASKSEKDPSGWLGYLAGLKRAYEPFVHAAPWIRDEFRRLSKK